MSHSKYIQKQLLIINWQNHISPKFVFLKHIIYILIHIDNIKIYDIFDIIFGLGDDFRGIYND